MEGKTDMIKLFSERFGEHEMPAPDGAWEAISSQLTLNAAAQTDHVNELFRDRFAEHTVEVDPGVWSHISGQLGHGVAAGGWGSVAAWAGAGIAALVLTGTVVWLNREDPVTVAEGPGKAQQEAPATPTASDVAPQLLNIEPVPASASPVKDATPEATTVPSPKTDDTSPAASVIPQIILNEMAQEAKEEPLKPEDPGDPRVVAEHRPIQDQPVMGYDPPEQVIPTTDRPLVEPPPVSPADDDITTDNIGTGDAIDQEPKQPFSLYLPNVFTPNGDGINDAYTPEGDGHASVKIRVYSMTNNQELVFSADESRAWDGTYFNGGQQCPEGMYLYAIEVIDATGRAHTEGQVVNLLR